MMKKNTKPKAHWLRRSRGEIAFSVFNHILMIFLCFITLLPMWHVIMGSLSVPTKLFVHPGIAWYPIGGISLDMYKSVFQNPNVMTGYANTIFYAASGTLLSLFVNAMAAYTLCRYRMWNNVFITFMMIPMFFGGGLIPTYLVMKSLGLLYTRTIMIITGCVSMYNIIVLRTTFSGLPDGLIESAKIDGANDFWVLWRIVVPLCKATVAVIALFSIVGHWNNWYTAYIYLKDDEMMPLQIFLRRMLIEEGEAEKAVNNTNFDTRIFETMQYIEAMQYAFAIVAMLPILVAYPFLQRYFVKGVMVGAIKG